MWGRHRRGVVLLRVGAVQSGVGCPVLVMQVGVGGSVFLVGLTLVDILTFGCGCDGGVGHCVLLSFPRRGVFVLQGVGVAHCPARVVKHPWGC